MVKEIVNPLLLGWADRSDAHIGQILPEDNKSIELFTKGGKTQVKGIEVCELNSAGNRIDCISCCFGMKVVLIESETVSIRATGVGLEKFEVLLKK